MRSIVNENLAKYYEDESARFLDFLKISYPYVQPPKEWLAETNPDKALAFFDPHEPYAIEEIFRDSLKHKDAETVIIGGDLGDFYSKSRFPKKHSVDFFDEVREIFFRMEWLSTHFKKVKIMKGNHDDRPEKKIASIFQDGEIDLHILTENNLLGKLAAYFDNVEIVGTKIQNHNYNITLSHIWQYNDIIFTHAEISRKQDSAIMEYVSQYLYLWKDKLQLKPYRIIAQGHNHRMMKEWKGGEGWLLCPCVMQDVSIGGEYIYSPRMQGSPPLRGYLVIYQKDGLTDWNKTNIEIYQ